jgi:hypothetical protein
MVRIHFPPPESHANLRVFDLADPFAARGRAFRPGAPGSNRDARSFLRLAWLITARNPTDSRRGANAFPVANPGAKNRNQVRRSRHSYSRILVNGGSRDPASHSHGCHGCRQAGRPCCRCRQRNDPNHAAQFDPSFRLFGGNRLPVYLHGLPRVCKCADKFLGEHLVRPHVEGRLQKTAPLPLLQ